MTTFLSLPAAYKDISYRMYVFCDRRSQKGLFCLSTAWSSLQQTFILQDHQALANRRIRAIGAFLSVQINFEKTSQPYNFDRCNTIDEIKTDFNHLISDLEKQAIDADKLSVVKLLPLFPKVIFSSELEENQLRSIPASLIPNFNDCMISGSLAIREKKLRNLARDLIRESKDFQVLILADLAQNAGLEGAVIEEQVKELVANQQFDQALEIAEKLPDIQSKKNLLVLMKEQAEATLAADSKQLGEIFEANIFDMVIPEIETKSKASREDVQELLEEAMQMDEGIARDDAFEKICEILMARRNYKDAFEYSDNIDDLIKQSFVRFRICQELPNNKHQLKRQIRECIQDSYVKEQVSKEASPTSHSSMNSYSPMSIRSIPDRFTQALGMARGKERDRKLAEICQIASMHGKHEEAFKYSEEIEDVELQSSEKLKICKALGSHNPLLVQQIADSIKDMSVVEQAYEILISKKNPIANFGAILSTQIRQDPKSFTSAAILFPNMITTTTNLVQIASPKDEWHQRFKEIEKIDEQQTRELLLNELAQEALEKGWMDELALIAS